MIKYDKKCENCGAIIPDIYDFSEYVYKTEDKYYRRIWFCGWECMRKYKKEMKK